MCNVFSSDLESAESKSVGYIRERSTLEVNERGVGLYVPVTRRRR